jgi:hypothetical protein
VIAGYGSVGWGGRPVAGLLVALIAATAAAQPSAPGRGILPAAETARLTVVGRIDGVTHLDRSGYAATVQVERVLAGAAQPGTGVRIGWEELAAARPPRFADQQRVLVVLDDLPAGSLWRQRFPTGSAALAVAERGDAFLPEPTSGDLDLLAAYLQLGRTAPAVVRATALSHMVAAATPALAGVAVARLASTPELGAGLDAAAVDRVLHTAADADKPLALRRAVIALAGSARLAAAAPPLEGLARPGAVLEPEALVALGEIRGGLPPSQVEALLDRPEAGPRAVGARFATGAVAERRLPPLVRGDAAPRVRAAAAQALAATRTAWGLEAAVPALADPDPQVRSAAAQALGEIGSAAVPALETVALTQPAEARGAITALTQAGPTGVAVVRRLATEHPDPRLRDFARLALGQGPHAH